MLVAIDVDSTLHDYWEQFSAAALALHGVELPYADQRAWAVDALSGDQIRQVVEHTHDDERIGAAIAYPDAADVINAWRRDGHQILISTHRREDAHDVTAEWLASQGIGFDLLRCGMKKVDHCRAVGVGLLIDDAPENLETALDQGIATATISHPWNRELLGRRPQITHAPDWARLGHALGPLLGR